MDHHDGFRTERLRLRPWRVTDAAFQRRLWQERDDRVPARRRITPDGHPTVAELEQRIRTDERTPAPGLFVVELATSAEAVGYCGLVANSVGVPQEPELAFEFFRASWGRGFATEAARVIVDDAASHGYGHLAATVRAWNAASLHVLDKLGFVDTGVREPDPVHGDSLLLRLRLRL